MPLPLPLKRYKAPIFDLAESRLYITQREVALAGQNRRPPVLLDEQILEMHVPDGSAQQFRAVSRRFPGFDVTVGGVPDHRSLRMIRLAENGSCFHRSSKIAVRFQPHSDVAAFFREVSDRLAGGRGTLGGLLKDEPADAGIRQASQDLQAAMANLKEITAKINEGEGTLGALIADPTVYERLVSILDGAQRSYLLRGLLRGLGGGSKPKEGE